MLCLMKLCMHKQYKDLDKPSGNSMAYFAPKIELYGALQINVVKKRKINLQTKG